MTRREWIKAAAFLFAAIAGVMEKASARVGLAMAPNPALYARCAKACRECQAACQTCAKHCAGMVKAGMKEHTKSLQLAQDCMEICALCAKLCERKGPMAVAAAEACRKACDACGAECKKYPTMQPMMACAKACTPCSKACQDLIAAK